MKVNGQPYRTIWLKSDDPKTVQIIDQRPLPHQFVIADLTTTAQAATAIREMWVRGAPLIGATAAWGMYLACLEAVSQADPTAYLHQAREILFNTRPTAVNLPWALDRMMALLLPISDSTQRIEVAKLEAEKISEEEFDNSLKMGHFGLDIIQKLHEQHPDRPVNILTHCNAGWLATVDYGTATAPMYVAHDAGIPIHVWVDETRPRNQGARITAWELGQHGIPHTVITDNTGGHLMQHGMVDLVIVGTDRTTRTGDVANKIGTYLKALAAWDNDVPFYVAAPSTSIDWTLRDGIQEIPIETRDAREVTHIQGKLPSGEIGWGQLTPDSSPALNYGFDVTPAKYVTGLITERGISTATEDGLLELFPEHS
ncbi:S-methyl-5-thioribose-1-phosphate isomerase [Pontibacter sp. G13]|uniref:S-methyl-5-thioribose-1-phosphate isomerase n=1 Tax=Pontibacter sp. G13 TaxID=3074898 RepID=UPI00288C177C|nr:S-methyl-5-thioribose-1-phosphate isomerase [Pontibacter sp. G13]WNJ19681.1 S-methyl-5-thioribose-1-phosphate isomerase [Pontibacter sp. G13]